MLKLLNPDTGERLPSSEIDFSRGSKKILEGKGGYADPHYDRAMELGGDCGDLLVENMPAAQARETTMRLSEDIYPPERREAFLLGVHNAIEINLERRSAAEARG